MRDAGRLDRTSIYGESALWIEPIAP